MIHEGWYVIKTEGNERFFYCVFDTLYTSLFNFYLFVFYLSIHRVWQAI